MFEDSMWEDCFVTLKNVVSETDYYVHIEKNQFVKHNDKVHLTPLLTY